MKQENSQWPRRKFITTGLQVGGLAVVAASPVNVFGNKAIEATAYTVGQISDMIFKETGFKGIANTVDTIKAGSSDMKVTGIVTTMFPTIKVIHKAIELKANLLIVHEPTFYSGNIEEKKWAKSSEVIDRKTKLLNDNNITIWRAHDSWHTIKPDGITNGVIKKIGWENYYKGEKTFTIPSASLKQLVKYLKQKMDIEHVRIVGDKDDKISKVSLLPGAWGGVEQMNAIINDKPDVLIVGEVSEWETAEYVRDARALGDNISLIILGHAMSEEPGMQWIAEWLQPKLPGLPITHIVSGNPLKWV